MSINLLLIPAVGGYWLLTHWNYTRYQMLRAEGYHVFFSSLFAGVVLLFVSELLIFFVPNIENFLSSVVPDFNGSSAVVLSVLFGLSFPYILNLVWFDKRKEALRDAKERGDLIEQVFADSINREKLVELSLSSGKLYIGFVLDRQIALRSNSDIGLLPVASGYRDKDTHELKITTRYSSVIKYLRDSGDLLKDLRVFVPMSEIISARLFDPELYESQFSKDGSLST